MNTTVARIVEIMFQDTIMNDEVTAIKDEVMNNCQERYEDLVARGMDEDVAIAAVVDSLKGMEEVIAQYPRKAKTVPYQELNGDTEKDLAFAAEQFDAVNLLLTSEDVNLKPSEDEMVHVRYDSEDVPDLRVEVIDGALDIRREMSAKKYKHNSGARKLFGNMHIGWNLAFDSKGYNGGDLTICLPEQKTFQLEIVNTSGDVCVNDVKLSTLSVCTTTGDVDVNLDEAVCLQRLEVNGTSGDIDVCAGAQSMKLNTVSGDIDYRGDCPDMEIGTVSGNGDIAARTMRVNLNAVSGDMELNVLDDALKSVSANSTSGDVIINLPECLQNRVTVQMNTLSGDCLCRFDRNPEAPLAIVCMNSTSGDLRMN